MSYYALWSLQLTDTDSYVDAAAAYSVADVAINTDDAVAYANDDDDDKVWCHIMHFEVCN